MVTSTTRSSSLASIMRTGGGAAPGAAASACSISVWPGNPTPAADSASLWIGAVTIARPAPARIHATACSMQRAAAAPARASMRRTAALPGRLGQARAGTHTASVPGGQLDAVGGMLEHRHRQHEPAGRDRAPQHADVARPPPRRRARRPRRPGR